MDIIESSKKKVLLAAPAFELALRPFSVVLWCCPKKNDLTTSSNPVPLQPAPLRIPLPIPPPTFDVIKFWPSIRLNSERVSDRERDAKRDRARMRQSRRQKEKRGKGRKKTKTERRR